MMRYESPATGAYSPNEGVYPKAGQLDNISRRFAWFRRILANHYDEGHAEVFPTEWRVGEHLCARFVDITRYDLHTPMRR